MLSLLLAVPSCIYSFWHGVIPTSYFIFNDFYTCIVNSEMIRLIVFVLGVVLVVNCLEVQASEDSVDDQCGKCVS